MLLLQKLRSTLGAGIFSFSKRGMDQAFLASLLLSKMDYESKSHSATECSAVSSFRHGHLPCCQGTGRRRSSLFEQSTPVGLKVSDTAPQITNIEFSDQDVADGWVRRLGLMWFSCTGES